MLGTFRTSGLLVSANAKSHAAGTARAWSRGDLRAIAIYSLELTAVTAGGTAVTAGGTAVTAGGTAVTAGGLACPSPSRTLALKGTGAANPAALDHWDRHPRKGLWGSIANGS